MQSNNALGNICDIKMNDKMEVHITLLWRYAFVLKFSETSEYKCKYRYYVYKDVQCRHKTDIHYISSSQYP